MCCLMESTPTHGGKTSAACFPIFRNVFRNYHGLCPEFGVTIHMLSTGYAQNLTCLHRISTTYPPILSTYPQLIHRFWRLSTGYPQDTAPRGDGYPQVIHRLYVTTLRYVFTLSKRYQTFFASVRFVLVLSERMSDPHDRI